MHHNKLNTLAEITTTSLLLASASKARANTLRNAGISPYIVPSEVDEELVLERLADSTQENPSPQNQTNTLAAAKGQNVVRQLTEGKIKLSPFPADACHGMGLSEKLLVVGCDSMLELDGQMLGKPHDQKVAIQRITEMNSRDARLWTGHYMALLHREETGWKQIDSQTEGIYTVVHFGEMTEAEIEAYVATTEPLEVAGAFTIDGLGGPFINSVTGDPHSVVGISLPLLRKLGNSLGIFWPSLWNTETANWPTIRDQLIISCSHR